METHHGKPVESLPPPDTDPEADPLPPPDEPPSMISEQDLEPPPGLSKGESPTPAQSSMRCAARLLALPAAVALHPCALTRARAHLPQPNNSGGR